MACPSLQLNHPDGLAMSVPSPGVLWLWTQAHEQGTSVEWLTRQPHSCLGEWQSLHVSADEGPCTAHPGPTTVLGLACSWQKLKGSSLTEGADCDELLCLEVRLPGEGRSEWQPCIRRVREKVHTFA